MSDAIEDTKTPITGFDFCETEITIACSGSTGRLKRMLEVFQRAMTLAGVDQLARELSSSIIKLHDDQGHLTVYWKDNNSYRVLNRYIEEAWEEEGEDIIVHKDISNYAKCTPKGVFF